MLDGSGIPELIECIDPETLRVYAPTPVVFLCGGKTDAAGTEIISLRDAFLRFAYTDPFKAHRILLAEELNGFFPQGQYSDILQLESDIAQISDLIILFSESYGSAAELGAFSVLAPIASNLLVVIDDKNYEDISFVRLGPIKALENKYGEAAVCVINRADVGISSITDVRSLDLDVFRERVNTAIKIRLAQTKPHSSFNKDNTGHIAKLIVGFVQHYGSLTIEEIKLYTDCLGLGISEARIFDLLLCAGFAGWVQRDKRGLRTYYSAKGGKHAIGFELAVEAKGMDRDRWRSDIRQHWKAKEPDRFSSIKHALGL